jgi:dihydrofolate synthase/folylpolyglutamate synthase
VPVISVAGTNGKGSSCALIDAIARAAGWRVGLYSKPHLVDFEERCRIDGRNLEASALLPHFEAVEVARGDSTLTYFEFTTLAIMRALSQAPLDLVILEVGLGGRLDAVNVVDADVALITSIAIDHTEYLGPDRDAIGREKAGIARAGRPVVVADPQPPAGLIDALAAIGAQVSQQGRDFRFSGDRQQWAWQGQSQRYAGLAYPALRGANQLLNAAGALAALESLRDRLPINAQAVRRGLATVDLPGRFQIVPGEPTLVLDVAHNPQAVAALAVNLDQMGFYPRTMAVFGAMRDKDIGEILLRIAPLIDAWHVCALPAARAATTDELVAALALAQEATGSRAAIQAHAGPREALLAALAAADPVDRIVVFGSFYTVGGVLKNGLPARPARHLG